MSLFDGKPIEPDDVLPQHRTTNSVTIRDSKGRTRRRQPYHVDLGLGPDGKKCCDCAHFVRRTWSSTYYKCGLHRQSGGPATDIGARDPACSRFEAAP